MKAARRCQSCYGTQESHGHTQPGRPECPAGGGSGLRGEERKREMLWLIRLYLFHFKKQVISVWEKCLAGATALGLLFVSISGSQKRSAFRSCYCAARARCPEGKGCYNTLRSRTGKCCQGRKCFARMVAGSGGETLSRFYLNRKDTRCVSSSHRGTRAEMPLSHISETNIKKMPKT